LEYTRLATGYLYRTLDERVEVLRQLEGGEAVNLDRIRNLLDFRKNPIKR
jgi:hypothetical protein